MKSNNIVIGALVAVIALMGVAFAAFSASLKINGTGTISSTWSVQLAEGTCTATSKDSSKPSSGTVSASGLVATVVANMASPGDVLTCTVKAENHGTLKAIRSSWAVTTAVSNSTAYTVAATAPTAAALAAKSGTTVASETLTITVTYKNVTSKPSGAATFKATAVYVQSA